MKGYVFSAKLFRFCLIRLLYGIEPSLQIVNDIIDVLRADGETDRTGFNALILQFRFRELAVGGSCGMDYKAFGIGDVREQRENFQAVNKSVGLLDASFDFKGKDGTASVWKISVYYTPLRAHDT